jgi:hypothetical protein
MVWPGLNLALRVHGTTPGESIGGLVPTGADWRRERGRGGNINAGIGVDFQHQTGH